MLLFQIKSITTRFRITCIQFYATVSYIQHHNFLSVSTIINVHPHHVRCQKQQNTLYPQRWQILRKYYLEASDCFTAYNRLKEFN